MKTSLLEILRQSLMGKQIQIYKFLYPLDNAYHYTQYPREGATLVSQEILDVELKKYSDSYEELSLVFEDGGVVLDLTDELNFTYNDLYL
jgi:hypothetical protein